MYIYRSNLRYPCEQACLECHAQLHEVFAHGSRPCIRRARVAPVCVCVYECIYMYVYVYIYMHMYIHTYIIYICIYI